MISTAIDANKEWQVIFNEGKNWRIGIYRPKYRSAAEIAELDEDERQGMLEASGLTEPALAVLARAAYRTLGLQSYFIFC